MSDTIFDRVLRRELPVQTVFEDEAVLAFRDIAPQAPVHVLVIPKRKWARFAEFQESDALAIGLFMASIAKIAKQLGLEQNGYRIVFNNGKDAQQSVEYIHAHILGGRELQWPPG